MPLSFCLVLLSRVVSASFTLPTVPHPPGHGIGVSKGIERRSWLLGNSAPEIRS